MKKLLLILAISLAFVNNHSMAAGCNWKSKILSFKVTDSCSYSYKSLNGKVSLNSSTNITYEWKVMNNGNINWTNNAATYVYYPGSNGTYTVCLKLTDVANKCDTTICQSISFNCLPKCNWKGQNIDLRSTDSCKSSYVKKNSINGILYTNGNNFTRYTYEWKINGTKIHDSSSTLHYFLSSNGTYTMCVKISDTINKCDTTLCKTFTVTCVNNCNWVATKPVLSVWDSCDTHYKIYMIAAGISFNGMYSGKYPSEWRINGTLVQTGNDPVLQYYVTSNGTYQVCVKVKDTIKKCDTTFCTSVTVNCIPCQPWKNRLKSFYVNDTCNGRNFNGVVGWVYMTNPSDEYTWKFKWTMNSTIASKGSRIDKAYPDGTYKVCLNIRDTINNCDTSICRTIIVRCKPCNNWKTRIKNISIADSCSQSYKFIYGQVQLDSTSNISYKWKIYNGSDLNWGNTGSNFLYYPGSNGDYIVCVTIRDEQTNCDTTICRTIDFKCLPKCNWKGQHISLRSSDSCKTYGSHKNSINGTLFTNGNYSNYYNYQWKVNGSVKQSSGPNFHYPVSANGTYSMCVTITDTSNKCDTTLCYTFNFNCIKTCNWKNTQPNLTAWDTCHLGSKSFIIYGGISFNGTYSSKYPCTWTINGKPISGTGSIFQYTVNHNGTYLVCVKVKDSSNTCDTTMCTSVVVNCIPCKPWKDRIHTFYVHDTCDQYPNKVNNRFDGVTGFVELNDTAAYRYCKLNWTINSSAVSPYSSSRIDKVVNRNDTYKICLKITDTLNHCDTTLCKTVVVNCKQLGIESLNKQQFNLNIYPNPSNIQFQFEWAGSECTYQLTDVLGHLLNSGSVQSGLNTIQTGSLANGVYWIKMDTGTGIYRAKVLISH